mmetsp:Transcript_113094/g.320374  ORF Transcript_113094/g.320374 Transcript_113094/m.320374 type:complete len:392 (+) Transcript_113094:81-1256(+)
MAINRGPQDTTYNFHDKEQYDGNFKVAMRADANDAEAAGLKAYGVDLSAGHMDGYIPGGEFTTDKSGTLKSWDVPLLQQMGEAKPMRCASAEAWDNEDFLFEVREGIAYCTLNRPAANNAMNETITAGLHDSAIILRNRPDLRIVVLTGNGRMFCAGGDPKTFQAAQAAAGAIGGGGDGGEPENPSGAIITGTAAYLGGAGGNESSAVGFARDLAEWASLPQFTICCMNGSAMGGGVGLICNCDMVVAVKSAHCTLSEVKLGVIPATISPHVIRTIGESNSKRLFSTAENCNMAAAMDFGLVQRIVNDTSEFPVVVAEMAKKIQGLASGALAATKQTLLNTINQPTSQTLLTYVCTEYARIRKDKECEEGMNALSQKKKPVWVDRKIDVKQ